MYGFLNVWVFVYVCFIMCGCVCIYGIFNMWVCICMGFLKSGCVYVCVM